MGSSLQRLVGRTLRSVTTSADYQKITFECANGDYVFNAEGDCCSQSYIDSIEGPRAGKIIEVREPEWGDTRVEQDGELKYYKATLVIEGAGYLDIEYRNESNGYYGGSLELHSAPEECLEHDDCVACPEMASACKKSVPIRGTDR